MFVAVNPVALTQASASIDASAATLATNLGSTAAAIGAPVPAGTDDASILATTAFSSYAAEFMATYLDGLAALAHAGVTIEQMSVMYDSAETANALLQG